MELPPLHSMLVNFTAALVPISVISDVLGRLTGRESLRSTGWWTLAFATAITPLTVVAGSFWLDQMGGHDSREMTIHQWLGTSFIGVLAALLTWRLRPHRNDRSPSAAYLIVAGFVVVALTLQGHLGGIMSFGSGATAAGELSPLAPAHRDADPNLKSAKPAWRDFIEVGPNT